MKKKFIPWLVCVILLMTSCSTKEHKVKKLISEYFKEYSHDWSSYESINYSSLDSAFTQPDDTPEYKDYLRDLGIYKSQLQDQVNQAKLMAEMPSLYTTSEVLASRSMMNSIKDKFDAVVSKMDSIEANFTPQFIGFSIIHNYRANNQAGNKNRYSKTFIFDENLSKIIAVHENEE